LGSDKNDFTTDARANFTVQQGQRGLNAKDVKGRLSKSNFELGTNKTN